MSKPKLLIISHKNGTGLMAAGMPLLCFDAWPSTTEDLEKAHPINDLPHRETITVNPYHKEMVKISNAAQLCPTLINR